MSAPLALAIPFYSGWAYLAEALESVRAQDDPHWTLVVVDDSPRKDEARTLVAELGDARVRYLANPGTLGMVPAWNRCLDEAQGELVTLLHADDRLLPGYVRTMKALAKAHPRAVALFCRAHTVDARGARRFSLQDDVKRLLVPRAGREVVLAGEPGLRALMRGDFIVCPSVCWRKSVLGTRRFEPSWRQVQDLELLTRLLLEGETLVGSRSAHYAYRRHDANATARQTESLLRFEEEYVIFDAIAARARAAGWERAARTAEHKLVLRLHLAWRVVAELARLRVGLALRTLRFLLAR
jgi:glycosyltransferase involved in cell wall biosynthesis